MRATLKVETKPKVKNFSRIDIEIAFVDGTNIRKILRTELIVDFIS